MTGAGVWAQVRRWPYRLRSHVLRQHWGQELAARLGHELHPDRWVFILSCYNSGTTLLRQILGRHPAIGILPGEGVRFTDVLPRPEQFGWNRMWCQCVDAVRLPAGPATSAVARRIQRQWSLLFPRRPVLLEKSIANAARLPFLADHFRPAYCIYIVRNGYAVAEGIRRKAQPLKWGNGRFGPRYPISLCAQQWRDTDRLLQADRGQAAHFLVVSYEELTAQPAAVLGRITRFLELDPLPASALAGTFSVHGVVAPIHDMNGPSLARLQAADLDAIEAVAGEELDRYGYRRPAG